MKFRLGFCSNSSSSSFILCGIKLSKQELQLVFPKMKKDEDFDIWDYEGKPGYPDIIYNDNSDKEYFAGKLIASFSDEDILDNGEFDKAIFQDPKVKLIKRKCKSLPDLKIRIYYGTRAT